MFCLERLLLAQDVLVSDTVKGTCEAGAACSEQQHGCFSHVITSSLHGEPVVLPEPHRAL